jgi:hypothetical protein
MGIFAICLVEALKVVFIPVVCIICTIYWNKLPSPTFPSRYRVGLIMLLLITM